jgi:hypothetical protein
MDLLTFREQMDHASPELVQILDLLQSIAPDPEQIVIRTALTCDTINPWGTPDAELERYTGRMYEGKQF